MPQSLLETWKQELASESAEFEDKLRWRIEAYLDQGYGASYLSDGRIANIVQNALFHFDGVRYRLSEWVVMPNHVHLLAAPGFANSLSDIMHSIKSYTAQEANKILGRKGRFWFGDYFDRYIRNGRHFENAVNYIKNNPVSAGLCVSAREWRLGRGWGCARSLVE